MGEGGLGRGESVLFFRWDGERGEAAGGPTPVQLGATFEAGQPPAVRDVDSSGSRVI